MSFVRLMLVRWGMSEYKYVELPSGSIIGINKEAIAIIEKADSKEAKMVNKAVDKAINPSNKESDE
jgi:hypothetical protein